MQPTHKWRGVPRVGAGRDSDEPSGSAYARWLLEPVDQAAVYAALDAGCGIGSITAELRIRLESWTLVAALDIDQSALRRCAAIAGVDAARGDIARLPYPDGTFDLVLAGHVLYYPGDVTHWLKELHRVTSSNGTLIAATNSASSGRRLLELHARACRQAGETAMADRALEPDARDRFTLENGAGQLERVFSQVTSRFRDEALVFGSVDSALDLYLGGLFARGAPIDAKESDLARLAAKLAPQMRAALESAASADGLITVPRRSGCLIALP